MELVRSTSYLQSLKSRSRLSSRLFLGQVDARKWDQSGGEEESNEDEVE